MSRRLEIALALAAAVVPAALLLPSLWFGFLYDDARMVLVNRGPAEYLVGAFLAPRDGFYRPLFSLAVGLQANLFGEAPIPYHVVSLLLHAASSAVVGAVAAQSHGRRLGWVGGLLFLGLGTHVEAVVWISGVNNVLAALAVAVAVWALGRAEGGAPRRWCLVAVAAWALGTLAKENAALLPIALLARWWWIGDVRRASWQLGWFVLPSLLLLVGYVPTRLNAGVAYSVDVGPALLLKNALYYAVTLALPLPDDYRYVSDLTAWREQPWLPALLFVLLLPAALWASRQPRALLSRDAIGWLLWTAVMGLPVLPILAERLSYHMGIGVVLALTALAAHAQPAHRRLGVAALTLLFVAHWTVLAERVYWWSRAVDVSTRMTNAVVAAAGPESVGLAVYNAPDRIRFAHVQGAHFCWTLALASHGAISPESPGCLVTVDPDHGRYTADRAIADAREHARAGRLRVPARAIVLDDGRIIAAEAIQPSG